MRVGPEMMLLLLLAKRVCVARRMDYKGTIGDVAQQTVQSRETAAFCCTAYRTTDIPCDSFLCECTKRRLEVGGGGRDEGADQAGHGVLALCLHWR